jgi:alkylation response protein AidB-like acyl-CoA dehydrogenase
MDLSYTPEQIAFRREVRAWIEAAMPPHLKRKAEGAGHYEQPEVVEWHKILYAKGWIAPHWPKEVGGTGWNIAQRHIFGEELVRANAPQLSPFGLGMVGPLLIQYGNDAEEALPSQDPLGRRSLVSGLLRAERRLRPRVAAAARRQGRRRLHPQRPEDVDHQRAIRALDLRPRPHQRRRQEAGRHHLRARRRPQHARHHREAVPHHRRY